MDIVRIKDPTNYRPRKPGLKRKVVYQGRSTLQLHSEVEWLDFHRRCKTCSSLESFHSNKSCLNSYYLFEMATATISCGAFEHLKHFTHH